MSRALLTSLVAVLCSASLAARADASFPATVKTTVAPGGSAQIGSPTLPPDAKRASVDIAPADGKAGLFEKLQIMFAGTKSKKTRLLTCVYLYAVASSVTTDESSPVSFKGADPSLAFLLLAACAQMALQIPPDSTASAAAASPCDQAKRAVAIEVTKASGAYHAEIDAPSQRTTRKVPLRIACRPRGAGVRLKVRPRSRRKTLRQVVGPSLSLGILSPPDAEDSIAVKATYRQPR
jgi:hypothetical protein